MPKTLSTLGKLAKYAASKVTQPATRSHWAEQERRKALERQANTTVKLMQMWTVST